MEALLGGKQMYQIIRKQRLNDSVTLMEIAAPHVAKKALPGQFIIFRVDDEGERVPLTIAGYDRDKGTVTIFFSKSRLFHQPAG
jgi:ferredoxin--NADP+ reductase